jgi:FMN phosphatase YigB (HAD superfamily)
MNHPELEKNSAPLLELFQEREIKTVAFDIDNTVLDTGAQFHETLYALGLEIALDLPFPVQPPYHEEMTRQLEREVYGLYYKNKRKPRLIGGQYEEIVISFMKENQLGEITPSMIEKIQRYENMHYTTSPKAYEKTKEILELILRSGKNIVFNSHAQQDWTERKIEYISTLIEDAPQFQFIAVPIEQEKDCQSWATIYQMADTKPENTLTVGDNFDADIIPAIQAGCKNVVWINSRGRELPEGFNLPEDTHLHIVENIADLRNISVDTRYKI